MNKLASLLVLALMAGCMHKAPPLTDTATVNGLRIELHVMAAEPFFTAAQVAATRVEHGMLIMGGALPMAPQATPKPNHHLVVNVYNETTNTTVTDAQVTLSFQPLDSNGAPMGALVDVPVVVMQEIGKGSVSTHYGNNVTMPAGDYLVTAMVNGNKAEFKITAADTTSDAMKGL